MSSVDDSDRLGHLARPDDLCGTGVLVLAGSSGAVEVERAGLLAAYGATALALRWFGGPGQPATPAEVPLETFTDGLDRLVAEPGVERLAVLGVSFGAEAALLTSTRGWRPSSRSHRHRSCGRASPTTAA